jgi:hypothetical protein
MTENDTVMIKFSFAGENFPITLTVYNKLDLPLYIDWSRSVVIINNIQKSGVFDRDGQISFIAPFSNVTVSSNSLQDKLFDLDLNDPRIKVSIMRGSVNGIRYTYDDKSTPLFFRNILALSPNEDYSRPTFYDNSFWISDIIKTDGGPSLMPFNPSNSFFIRKVTGFGIVFGYLAAITVLVLLGGVSSGQ